MLQQSLMNYSEHVFKPRTHTAELHHDQGPFLCDARGAPYPVVCHLFWQFEDVLYLGMSDELPETLMVLQLLALRDFVHLFGFPQMSAQSRKSQWKHVGQLMEVWLVPRILTTTLQTYEELLKNEQPFLFQGLEYISYSI